MPVSDVDRWEGAPSGLREMFEAVHVEVVWVFAKWKIFSQLYIDDKERVDFLNDVASEFFNTVQESLRDDIILSIARLTDPIESCGIGNLCLARLASLVPQDEFPKLHGQLSEKLSALAEQCVVFRAWRNRSIAHNSLPDDLQDDPLPGFTVPMIQAALDSIYDAMNLVGVHFTEAHTGYDNVALFGDGDRVVQILEYGYRYLQDQLESYTDPPPARTKAGWLRRCLASVCTRRAWLSRRLHSHTPRYPDARG